MSPPKSTPSPSGHFIEGSLQLTPLKLDGVPPPWNPLLMVCSVGPPHRSFETVPRTTIQETAILWWKPAGNDEFSPFRLSS